MGPSWLYHDPFDKMGFYRSIMINYDQMSGIMDHDDALNPFCQSIMSKIALQTRPRLSTHHFNIYQKLKHGYARSILTPGLWLRWYQFNINQKLNIRSARKHPNCKLLFKSYLFHYLTYVKQTDNYFQNRFLRTHRWYYPT